MFISHRGNLNGPNPESENRPDYIIDTLSKGYDVEIDVWCFKDNYYLGHDAPQYKVQLEVLLQDRLWLHCKNITAFQKLLDAETNCFFHNDDLVVLTGFGYKWYHEKSLEVGIDYDIKSIVAIPSQQTKIGEINICSDYLL